MTNGKEKATGWGKMATERLGVVTGDLYHPPAHARSQRGDVCYVVASMPFIKPDLSIQGQKPDVGMAKRPGECSGLKRVQ